MVPEGKRYYRKEVTLKILNYPNPAVTPGLMLTEVYTYYMWVDAAFVNKSPRVTVYIRYSASPREEPLWQATKASEDFDWRQRMRGHWRNSLKVGLFSNFLSFLGGKTEINFKGMPSGHRHIPKETSCIENVLLAR